MSNRKQLTIEDLINYYYDASDFIVNELGEIDFKLDEFLSKEDGVPLRDSDIQEIMSMLKRENILRANLNKYLRKANYLSTIMSLKKIGRQQTLLKTVSPLGINFGGIRLGSLCWAFYCDFYYGTKEPLAPEGERFVTTTFYAKKVAVWIGMYSTSIPNVNYKIGDLCTYEFPYSNSESVIHQKYWNMAYQKAKEAGIENKLKSIQIKFFYEGIAFNPQTGEWQQANLIFQYECDSNHCWRSTGNEKLPYRPDLPGERHFEGKVRVEKYYLKTNGGCCYGGDVGGMWCTEAKWANRHCKGCFAPDASGSQNFASIPFRVVDN